MIFEPTDEQRLVVKTAREFAERELAPRAAERDRTGEFPEGELRSLGDLGLLGVNVPAAHGGSEAGPVALALTLMEIARADASVAVAVSVTNMVGEIIARFGTDEARRAHLPRLCSGEHVAGAFALSESAAGSDPAGMTTTARRTDRGYVLRGAKQWTTSGDRAGVIVVMAKTAAETKAASSKRAISAFLVDRGASGLSVGKHEDKMGLHGSTTVALTFDDVEVPASSRLGQEGDGFKIALTALDGGRIGIASLAVGIARAALEAAMRYAGERTQFDRPISAFQAIKMYIADCATFLEAAYLLAVHAAWRKQASLPFTRHAAQAKLFASEGAYDVCDRAIQIMGGYGYTRDLPAERYMRDVRAASIYEGTSQIQRLVIARQILRDTNALE